MLFEEGSTPHGLREPEWRSRWTLIWDNRIQISTVPWKLTECDFELVNLFKPNLPHRVMVVKVKFWREGKIL